MLGLVAALALLAQTPAPDLDKLLERADAILDESKAAYESAREKSAASGFVEAGFKLEEARIKYIVLQEIGTPELQKKATDRLRAVNQLSKLIHDGKVAVSGTPADSPAPPAPAKPDAPSSPSPAPLAPETREPVQALKPPPDLRVRFAVPDAAKLKEAERLIKDIFKEQYAKKAPADRQMLGQTLLGQAAKTGDDSAALWVLYREAQDAAVQVCDLRTALAAVDGASAYFDVDSLSLRNSVLGAAGKNAKSPEDFAALARALLQLVEDQVAADQYDAAEKTAATALQDAKKAGDGALVLRATNRTREVAEAKTRFQDMKSVLQTLAKSPEDPAASNDMGQFLCFVKGSWDLGLRFLSKGSDAGLRGLAAKELVVPLEPVDQAAVGDGWWDLADQEKSPLRKTQMQFHARQLYEAALPGLPALQRMRVEKRLETADPAGAGGGGGFSPGAINLMKLIDLSKDVVAGVWKLQGDKLVSDASQGARVEIPYEPPPEYDFRIVFVRNDGNSDVFQALSKGGRSFEWTMGAGQNHFGFGIYRSLWVADDPGSIQPGGVVNGKTYTSLVQVRKDSLKGFLDGKLIKELPRPYDDLQPHALLRLRNDSLLGVGSYLSSTTFLKIELVEVTGKGKKLR